VHKDENCEEDDEPLFTSDWYGIKGVYYKPDLFGTGDRYIYFNEGSGKSKNSFIPPFPMIKQSIFNGRKICAKRMDDSLQGGEPGYQGMTHVDTTSFKCKDGYVSCGDDSRFNDSEKLNAACIKNVGDGLSNCPVTNIQILKSQDSRNYKQDDYNKIIDFNNEYKILVSKEVNSLPLA
jgi:hypothetical protein